MRRRTADERRSDSRRPYFTEEVARTNPTTTPATAFTIRSGAQTGVDRAALDFAIRRGFSVAGGWPRGGWAEDCQDPPGVLARYPFLVETPSAEPEQRTAWNVRDSHATLILKPANVASPGTRFTQLCAELLYVRPVCVIDATDTRRFADAAAWVARLAHDLGSRPFILNVAGPREFEAPGIYDAACRCLGEIFTMLLING
jgi:hypothetical protein